MGLHLVDNRARTDTNGKNLMILIDSKFDMAAQVNAVTVSCFHILKMLREIYKLLPISTQKTTIHALVTSKLDYWNTRVGEIFRSAHRFGGMWPLHVTL